MLTCVQAYVLNKIFVTMKESLLPSSSALCYHFDEN